MKPGQIAKSYDPTKTADIVKPWLSANRQRFDRLRLTVKAEALDLLNQSGDLRVNARKPSAKRPSGKPGPRYKYRADPARLARFRHWVSTRLDAELLSNASAAIGQAWYAGRHIASGYKRGMSRAVDEMIKAGIGGYPAILPVPVAAPSLFGTADYSNGLELKAGLRSGKLPDGSTAAITGAFNTPVHAERVALLYGRAFEGMRGLTDTMKGSLASTLAQGMVDGKNPYDIAKEIDRSLDIGLARANTIARTEIIRAHHNGAIETYRAAGVEGVKVLAELVTVSGDVGNFEEMHVCEKCQELQALTAQEPMSLDEIQPLIPVHPNCRCVAIPVITGIE